MKNHHKKSKNIIVSLGLFLGLTGSFVPIAVTNAAGGPAEWAQTVSVSSATSVVNSPATLTVRIYGYKCDEYGPVKPTPESCPEGSVPNPQQIGANSWDVSISVVGGTATPASGKTSSDGYISFQINSSSTGVASYTIYSMLGPRAETTATASGSITFTPPAPDPAPKPRATTAPVAPVVEVAPPATPTPTFTVAGKEVKGDEKPTITDKEKLTLSGKTVPNGVVTIYVFSEPKKYTTTADAEGNWTYDVSGLPAGDHHIETEVTDPATGKTSERKTVLGFSVIKAPTPAPAASTTSTPEAKKSPVVAILTGAAAAAALGGGGYLAWRRWGRKVAQG